MAIYFIQMGSHGPIKIGHTKNVDQRLRLLQSANPDPLTVRLILPGARAEELWLHAKFKADRISGEGGEGGREWFRPSEAILAFINSQPISARDHVLGWLDHRYNKPKSKAALKRRTKEELQAMQRRALLAERSGSIIHLPAGKRPLEPDGSSQGSKP